MANYEVYFKDDITKIIKIGFNWPAFIFSWMWAATKGLVIIAVLGYMISIAMHYCIYVAFSHFFPFAALVGWTQIPAIAFHLCQIAWQVIVGVFFGQFGNEWHRNKLLRKKYIYVETLQARNMKMAKILYELSNDLTQVP